MALTKNDIVAAVHELGFTKKKSVDGVEILESDAGCVHIGVGQHPLHGGHSQALTIGHAVFLHERFGLGEGLLQLAVIAIPLAR